KIAPQVEAPPTTLRRQDPQRVAAGSLATCRTVALPALTVGTPLAVAVSPNTPRTAPHRPGLRRRRPRLARPRQAAPEQAPKPWRRAGAALGAAAAGRYAAEARLPPLPPSRALWSSGGQRWRGPPPGSHAPRALLRA